MIPVGVIINRLSSDLGSMDKYVRHNKMQAFGGMIMLIITILTISIFYPVILLSFIPIAFLLAYIILYFSDYMTLCKNLDLKTKSPVISEINSTMNSLILIRAYE